MNNVMNRKSLTYMDANQPLEKRVEVLMAMMTLEEKVAQLGSYWIYQLQENDHLSEKKANELMTKGLGQVTRIGGASAQTPSECAVSANEIQDYLIKNTRLGIPAIVHEEACSGLLARGTTVFPQTIGVSSTWNPELVEDMGHIIRRQMRAAGMHQALAPLLDVTRDPRWGRVEETYGEDPYMVSIMATSFVKGLQGNSFKDGVVATGKHFVGYGLSEGGMNWAPAHIPERELREVFLHPFEAAVKEGKLASIMPGYHELDGVPCHHSKELLSDILRDDWGFDGIVVSDYFAITNLQDYHHIAKDLKEAAKMALEAGVDVELPNTDCFSEWLIEGVDDGSIDIAILDRAVERVLKTKFELGLFENPYVDADQTEAMFDTEEDRRIAKELANESIILLKNQDNLLPLDKLTKKIAIIGPNADEIRNMLGDYTYPSHIETLIEIKEQENTLAQPVPDDIDTENIHMPEMKSVLDAFRANVNESTIINYARGCDINSQDRSGFNEAVETAKQSDVAILVIGDKAGLISECTVGETRDTATLLLPGVQEDLVKAVVATGTPVVVVMINGRPYAINWIEENVPAIVEAWLPGVEGGQAIVDTVFGDNNPSGKLTISVPRHVGQIPVYYNHKKSGGRSHWRGDYIEMSTSPLYPFGYGLSYTTFEYTDFDIVNSEISIHEPVMIQITVTNTGDYTGREIVQLYTNDPEASVTRPVKELKGFKKVKLEAGESCRIQFELSPRQLGFYDMSKDYVVEPGLITVMIGSSSEDIHFTGSFTITGEKALLGDQKVFFSIARVI